MLVVVRVLRNSAGFVMCLLTLSYLSPDFMGERKCKPVFLDMMIAPTTFNH